MAKKEPTISNKQALRDYAVEKTIEAGIQLFGNEVKSLRRGEANLKGAFARVDNGEIYVYNMHISPYEFSRDEYDPLRPRKLLLHRSEIRHLEMKISQQGYTLVPLKIYFRRGYAKIDLGLAKGKKRFDKRQALKEKQIKKEVDREIHRKRKI